MVYSYYPGCTLKTKAKELDRYARKAANTLGFTLEEVKDWQCCGAVYPLAADEIATKLSAVRALNAAKEKGQDLVTLCSACHHVLKRVNDDMENVEDICEKNGYRKEQMCFVGDAVTDKEAAYHTGLQFIARKTDDNQRDFQDILYKVDNLLQIEKILGEM